jgi:RNA polymerase sigma factor (sigma-70 family)
MDGTLSAGWMTQEQDRRITEAVEREGGRLRRFVRRRLADAQDAEDVLQDVYRALVETERLMTPVDQIGAWLFRAARNRIVDLFRRKHLEAVSPPPGEDAASFLDLLPSADASPEEAYARQVLMDEIEAALDDLPEDQRAVFVAHEIEGRSFRDLAAESGVGVNTLLSRKRYAVLHLRRRLGAIYEEFTRG